MIGANRSKWILRLAACGIVGCLLIVFPPFHIVPLELAREKAQAQAFDPAEFALRFWQEQLPSALDNAHEAVTVLDAIRRDRTSAKARYGRVVGLGGPHHYFLKGTGKIVALGERWVELTLSGNDSERAEIVLVTSMIFGNEILNATGLVKHSQFKRTNEYNAVSAEVNEIVESELAPAFLEEAKVGSTVHFVGCSSKISDDDPMPIPMRLVPVKLEVE
jgi:predicted lipoprotein